MPADFALLGISLYMSNFRKKIMIFHFNNALVFIVLDEASEVNSGYQPSKFGLT